MKNYEPLDEYALFCDGTATTNHLSVAEGSTPSDVLNGSSTGVMAVHVRFDASLDQATGLMGLGQVGSGFNYFDMQLLTSQRMQIRVRETGIGTTTTASHNVGTINGIVDYFLVIDINQSLYWAFVNGSAVAEGSAFATIANLGPWTGDGFTLYNRSGTSRMAPFRGSVYRAQVWYPGTLTLAQMQTAAKSLELTGTSSLLTTHVIDINPDATDANATVVRNQASGIDFDMAYNGSDIVFTSQEGLQFGGLRSVPALEDYARTGEDTQFDTDKCLWEWFGRMDEPPGAGTADSMMGDDAVQLEVLNTAGTYQVRFGAALSPTAEPVPQSRVYHAAGWADGTNKFAAMHGYAGTAAALGTTAPSGAFSVLAHGLGNQDLEGMVAGFRVWKFGAAVTVPTNMEEILRFQSAQWPAIHPILSEMLLTGDAALMNAEPSGITETTDNNFMWYTTTTNTDSAFLDFIIDNSGKPRPYVVNNSGIDRRVIHVGANTGTSGNNPGTKLNPYLGASALTTALAALTAGDECRVSATTTWSSTDVTVSVAGEITHRTRFSAVSASQKASCTQFKSLVSDVASLDIVGGYYSNSAGQGITGQAGTSKLRVIGVICDSCVGDGLRLNDLDNEVYNCLLIDNTSDGIQATGNPALLRNNIATGNTSTAINGHANTDTDYNCWNGTVTGATAGTYDLVGSPPLLKDISGGDYTHLSRSNTVYSGLDLTGWSPKRTMGPYSFFPKQAKKFHPKFAQLRELGIIRLI